MVFRIPTPKVSIVNLTCHLEKSVKYYDIKRVVKQASENPLQGILGYDEEKDVSCDSSNFDTGAGIKVIFSGTTL